MELEFVESARELLRYIDASPSPFHAVAGARLRLEEAGFSRLRESEPWDLEPRGRYYLTRNDSTIAAFALGSEPAATSGFRIVGAHTDSPGFRIKPQASFVRTGYQQIGLEIYGGPIVATWVDRDLGLSGRVVTQVSRDGAPGDSTGDGATGLRSTLVRIDRPLARISTVAIHLDREVNEKGLLLNKETQTPPILGMDGGTEWSLHDLLARELDVEPAQIVASDLMLHELTPSAISGVREEFLSASRLDNLSSSFCALTALIQAAPAAAAATRLIVLYDNEEIGSNTPQGAAGSFLEDLTSRLALRGAGSPEDVYRARARSFFVSADMAHAVHPNYPDKHEARHLPRLNAGPVIKHNANARYASDAESAAVFQQVCREAEVPFQSFVNRADLACGSTIGPVVATRLGIKSVDVGNSMLAMHSVREMAGARDTAWMIAAMRRFLERP